MAFVFSMLFIFITALIVITIIFTNYVMSVK